jgi:hypothetical protein
MFKFIHFKSIDILEFNKIINIIIVTIVIYILLIFHMKQKILSPF